MGYLRSCYSTQARFFYDSAIEFPIVWYWCEDGASRFSGRSTFAPITFSEPGPLVVNRVGEDEHASRPWRDGSIPVAPPTGILDGNPRWFETGQSINDPGLVRTPFGIPVNCLSGAFVPCTGEGLNHFTWSLEQPEGTVLGISSMISSSTCMWPDGTLFGKPVFMQCGTFPEEPAYNGLFLQIPGTGFLPHYYINAVLVSPGLYMWSEAVFEPPPFGILYTRLLPGP